MTRYAYTTHCKGSWKWQDRFALVAYRPRITRDGRAIWVSAAEINDKVKPLQVRGQIIGSLHNKPLTQSEIVLWALYGDSMTVPA